MTDYRPQDPTKSCWAFYAHRMKKEREKAGMIQEEVAHRLTISKQLYGHYEKCRRVPTLPVSKGLDEIYGLDQLFEELHPLVIEELELPPGFLKYAEQEAEASAIRIHQPLWVPGLMQSEGYAAEVLRAGQPPDRLEHLVAARIERQEIFTRDDPPWVFLLLSEVAIRNIVGSKEIMREQLGRLLELIREPRISIQIVPYGARIYPAGHFTMLGYPEGGDLAYVEAPGGNDRLIEIPKRVQRLAVLWNQIQTVALPADESEKLVRQVLESL